MNLNLTEEEILYLRKTKKGLESKWVSGSWVRWMFPITSLLILCAVLLISNYMEKNFENMSASKLYEGKKLSVKEIPLYLDVQAEILILKYRAYHTVMFLVFMAGLLFGASVYMWGKPMRNTILAKVLGKMLEEEKI